MQSFSKSLLLAVAGFLVATTSPVESASSYTLPLRKTVPTTWARRLKGNIFQSAAAPETDIAYHMGAPVLTDDVRLYVIHYGSDWTESQKTVVSDFLNRMSSSEWYKTNHKYYYQANEKAPREYIHGSIQVAQVISDAGSKGMDLKGNDIPDMIQSLVDAKKLPEDESGVYLFLTGANVNETMRDDLGDNFKFCKDYCGYHGLWPLKSGKHIYYAFAGLPTACMEGCTPTPLYQSVREGRPSPNNDAPLDGLIHILGHTLPETITNPDADGVRAWEDAAGYESSDKCAWSTPTEKPGMNWNVQIGDRKYLLQENWDPETQKCTMKP